MSRFKLIMTLLLISLPLTGCSTIKGVGQDLTAVGAWISQSSDHVKTQIHNNPPGSGVVRSHKDEDSHDTYHVYSENTDSDEIYNAGNWREGKSPNLKTDYLIDMSSE